MREVLYRLLSPPQRGTPKWWATTAASKISDWLLLAFGTMLIAQACGGFTPAAGSKSGLLMFALAALFTAQYATEPAVALLKKLTGHRAEDGRDI